MKKLVLSFSILIALIGNCLLAQTNPEIPLYPHGIQNNPMSHPMPETVVDSIINLLFFFGNPPNTI